VTFARRVLLMVVAVGLLFGNFTALAQRIWEPFQGITQLVRWFNELNDHFDQVVKHEQREQLGRSVDGVRKELYALEADTQVLLNRIPDKAPDGEKKFQLTAFVDRLLKTVGELGQAVRGIGADLRLAEADEIEARLTRGLYTREESLTFVQARIEGQVPWDAAAVRGRLKEGLAAVKDAQLAATKFSQRLARN
jgi:hypothetical protein